MTRRQQSITGWVILTGFVLFVGLVAWAFIVNPIINPVPADPPSHSTFDDSNVPKEARDSCAQTSLENGNGVADQERGLYIICIHAVQAQQSELSSIEGNN